MEYLSSKEIMYIVKHVNNFFKKKIIKTLKITKYYESKKKIY